MSFTLSISLHQPHFYLLHHYAFGPPRNGSFHADNIFLAKSTYKNTSIKLHEFNRDLSKIICQKKIYLLKNRPSFAPFGCNGLCSILLPTLGITFFFLGCRYHGPPFLNISSAFRNSKKKITQTHGILGIATVPSKGHHYVIMYTIYIHGLLTLYVPCAALSPHCKTNRFNSAEQGNKDEPTWGIGVASTLVAVGKRPDLQSLCNIFLSFACLWHRAQKCRY